MENYKLRDLLRLEGDKEALHATLVRLGLIPVEGTYMCHKCGSPLRLYRDSTRIDGYTWHCAMTFPVPKKKKKNVCGTRTSYRSRTLFANSKFSIVDILTFTTLWLARTPLTGICSMLGMVHNSAVQWANNCREVLYDAMALPVGGPGKIVEIDVSDFDRRKSHRGLKVEGQRIFGLYEQGSGNVCLFTVERNDHETLVLLIQERIRPGSTIISHQWRPYDSLGASGFKHLTDNHSFTFVEPNTGTHNSIEAVSRGAKKVALAPNTCKKKHTPDYFPRYMFYKRCRDLKLNEFKEFCRMAGELYDPCNPYSQQQEERNGALSEEDATITTANVDGAVAVTPTPSTDVAPFVVDATTSAGITNVHPVLPQGSFFLANYNLKRC